MEMKGKFKGVKQEKLKTEDSRQLGPVIIGWVELDSSTDASV